MPRCPNCSYTLVLLEKRRKYKCSKCGKLFLRKEVESKDFRIYNKFQKQKDTEEFDRQSKLRRKSLKPRKVIDPKIKQKKIREYRAAYYLKNKVKILAYKREWRKKAKERNNQTRKLYRQNKREIVKIWSRIHYWRQMQGNLALDIAYSPLDIRG